MNSKAIPSTPAAITPDSKSLMESAIWGSARNESSLQLDCFFGYCHEELKQAGVHPDTRVKQLDHVLSVIALLKSSHDKPKKELISHFDNATTVDLSLRLMLMTSCSPTGSAGEDIFRPWWKDHESLAQYMQRIYPRYDASTAGNGSQPISLRKLSADYLKTYAGIRIQWTNHLTDHLLLLEGSN